jgi:hypothetical protein
MLDYTLHKVGLMKHEMEQIVLALSLASHIDKSFKGNANYYEKFNSLANRFKTLIDELENQNA